MLGVEVDAFIQFLECYSLLYRQVRFAEALTTLHVKIILNTHFIRCWAVLPEFWASFREGGIKKATA